MSKFTYPDTVDMAKIVYTDAPSELHKLAAWISEGMARAFPNMTFADGVESHCAMLTPDECKALQKDLGVLLSKHTTDDALHDAWNDLGGYYWPPNEDHRAILQSACERLCD